MPGRSRDQARALPRRAAIHDEDRVSEQLKAARSYAQAFVVLRGHPLYGDFLAMQI